MTLPGLALLVALVAGGGSAQSLLDRPPDLGGTWVGEPGVLHFHLMHRFEATDAPTRKVLNAPTFLLAAGLPHRTMLGARYATNSAVRLGFPNEWEFFGRWSPLAAGGSGGPPPLALHAGWNQASSSFDAELAGGARLGPVRVLAALRGFSSPYDGEEARGAGALGAVLSLSDHVALSGDVATLFDREDDEEIAWGAGVQARIPATPHTLSLHASNVVTTTLEGASRGGDSVRWGFEFTVPVTLSRYFGRRPTAAGDRMTEGAAGSGGATAWGGSGADTVAAVVGMTNRLLFTPDTVRIRVGQSVRWENTSDLDHTVTADPSRATRAGSVELPQGAAPFDSGNLQPGAAFTRRFDVPGTYRYFCVPHEVAGMVGTVVVVP